MAGPRLSFERIQRSNRIEGSSKIIGDQSEPELNSIQTVLIIGAGVSSTDIARESYHGAKHIYQSSRGGTFDAPIEWLPPKTDRVAGISNFESPVEGQTTPGSVTLTDGTILTGIDKVIIATGYLFSLPFLPELHDDSLKPAEANDSILVTDGSQIHNLHKDIFYVSDFHLLPSLA